MSIKFKEIDFDLLYLGLLTKEMVKPLSRWEKSFAAKEIKFIKSLSLKSAIIERCLESGRKVEELIFSKNKDQLNEYTKSFMRAPIRYTSEIVELEGKFFGYPDCCVDSYLNYGEIYNGLSKDEQALLFHWACSDCSRTPKLLPKYRAIYEEAKRLKFSNSLNKAKFGRIAKVIPAFGLATFLLFSGSDLFSSSDESKSHLIRLENDLDNDYLKDEWEEPLKLNPKRFDTDGDGIPDGIQLALKMEAEIKNPPSWIKIDTYYYHGSYTCTKCGEMINMGGLDLINTQKNDSVYIRFLALHFMEHGSFAYEGEEAGASGIVNPVKLDSVLSP